ncbi:hypothetical protein N7G274_008414 [Stereocaulon virgatum]|uniref:Glycosyltransferase family 25 protein n=1 Tax=Stereocaulon virgatum TaxID=373712 RepID=A0ABR3ZYW3_9LECA
MPLVGFPRILLIGVLVFCLFTGVSFFRQHPQGRLPNFWAHQAANANENSPFSFKPSPGKFKDIRNSTLGFQKIFLINLPERPDKFDQFAIAASFTGFTYDLIEGVKGADVQNKSLPALKGLPATERARNNIVGCWRAHLNAARTIVRNGLSSALIIEDDADWDVYIKDQLQEFAAGSQFLSGVTAGPKPHSPYGDDWDLLWLGHCGAQFTPGDKLQWAIANDATVPEPNRRANFGGEPDIAAAGYDNSTRVVFRTSAGACTYSYALSYRGARRYLRNQALLETFTPIDLGISKMCKSKNTEFKCFAPFPQLIDSHKAAGRMSRDSDIAKYSADDVREHGFTFNIVHSIRLNIDSLLADENAPIQRQWPNDPEVIGPPRPRAMVQSQD